MRNQILSLLLLSLLPVSIALAQGKLVNLPKSAENHSVIAFDMDGTLIQFAGCYMSSKFPYDSLEFWKDVNSEKCILRSAVKVLARKLVLWHRSLNQRVIVITKRSDYGAGPVKKFLRENFGFSDSEMYFERKGKVERLREERVGLMYGDSDSDMKDAKVAKAVPVRILRLDPQPSRDDYHPGAYNEEMIIGSER